MINKTYVGKVEALELAFDRGIYELPYKGKEIITCYALATLKGYDDIIGKDGRGYYIAKRKWD